MKTWCVDKNQLTPFFAQYTADLVSRGLWDRGDDGDLPAADAV